jgi:SAM-dependent methyltransferase
MLGHGVRAKGRALSVGVEELPAVGPPSEPRAELLDRPSLPFEDRRRALADLARVNRWLLGNLPVLRALVPRLAAVGGRQLLLDLGTGSGETAALVAREAGRRGAQVRVVGLDRQLSHLAIGRRRAPGQGRVVGEADALPFRDGAFDWALSTLFFHHFEPAANRRILAEMRRVARRAAAVVDLRRSWATTLLARLLLPLLGLARTARHDGLVSVSRAAALAAVAELVEGQPVEELRRRFPCRFSLVLSAGFAPAGGLPRPGG